LKRIGDRPRPSGDPMRRWTGARPPPCTEPLARTANRRNRFVIPEALAESPQLPNLFFVSDGRALCSCQNSSRTTGRAVA
jgi:hypothetical protein